MAFAEVLHLDASKSGDLNDGEAVGKWVNLVEGYHDATVSGSARPALIAGALNGKPVVRFDGGDDWMDLGDLRTEAGNLEIFVVAQSVDAGGRTGSVSWLRMILAPTITKPRTGLCSDLMTVGFLWHSHPPS